MKKLFLIFIALFLISCNDDDYIPPIDYKTNITFNNSTLKHYSFDVLEFKSNVTNTSDKTIILDVSFDVYYVDTYFQTITLRDIEISRLGPTNINRTFDFRYFDYQHFHTRNLKFNITKAY